MRKFSIPVIAASVLLLGASMAAAQSDMGGLTGGPEVSATPDAQVRRPRAQVIRGGGNMQRQTSPQTSPPAVSSDRISVNKPSPYAKRDAERAEAAAPEFGADRPLRNMSIMSEPGQRDRPIDVRDPSRRGAISDPYSAEPPAVAPGYGFVPAPQ